MLSVFICCLLVLILFGGGYLLFMFLYNDDMLRASQWSHETIDYSPYYSDDLSKSILALINDIYSPYYPAGMKDHIVTDLDIDSLDIVDLLYDVEQISGTKLSAFELYQQYGRNPTVAQLISYVRRVMSATRNSTSQTNQNT